MGSLNESGEMAEIRVKTAFNGRVFVTYVEQDIR